MARTRQAHMQKRLSTFRLSEECHHFIDHLVGLKGISQAAVIEQAVKEMAEKESHMISVSQNAWVDIGMNEFLDVEPGGDHGPYFILYPFGPGIHYGNLYSVAVREESGEWVAQAPKMMQCIGRGATEEEARKDLAATVRDWLRGRRREELREAQA